MTRILFTFFVESVNYVKGGTCMTCSDAKIKCTPCITNKKEEALKHA